MKRIALFLFCLAAASSAVLIVFVPSAPAAGNHLDFTFGDKGKILSEYFISDEEAQDVVIQPDGKIVAVGSARLGAETFFAVFRYNADGSPDNSFGSYGRTITDFNSLNSKARAVALQSNGKIVVAGESWGQYSSDCRFAVARYNTDGSLDTTFDGNGILTLGFPEYGTAQAVAVTSTGKIVVAGQDGPEHSRTRLAVARLNSNGSLDTSFHYDGKVTTKIIEDGKHVFAGITVLSDGRIVGGGTAFTPFYNTVSYGRFLLIRYHENGTLDTTFGNSGYHLNAFSDWEASGAAGFARTSDGKFLLVGTASNLSDISQVAVARYTANGQLDRTLAGTGRVTTNLGIDSSGMDVAVFPNGDFVLPTHIYHPDSPYEAGDGFTLLRYRVNGSLNATFGAGGRVSTVFGAGMATANAVAVSGDRIIAAGRYLKAENDNDFAIARYKMPGIAAASDFTGDGRADFGQFRAADGSWLVWDDAAQTSLTLSFGLSGDVPTPGDYDGDGKTDAAVFRPSTGTWYVLQSSDGAAVTTQFGLAGDVPVQGDYDGDGRTDLAVFRPSENVWYLQRSTLGTKTVALGAGGDKPAQGDFDGDGLADPAVFRPSNGNWYFQRSRLGAGSALFGQFGDVPVPADYDGDGKTDLAVFRPINSIWYVLKSQPVPFGNSTLSKQWGSAGDIPAPADFDADGKADITVFRPSTGDWYSLRSRDDATRTLTWGASGDVPVSSAYTPQ